MHKKNYQYDTFFNKNVPTLDLHGETREATETQLRELHLKIR